MFSENEGEGYYFVGIGGVSMSALASLLHDRGVPVRGSDMCESEYTQALRRKGIPVSVAEDEAITENVVVYTGAVDERHRQLACARKAGKRLISRAELLGAVAEEYPHVLSVAGCHGKTTTTSMLAHIFLQGKRAFTCHIGGNDCLLGNYYASGNEWFITEACEFKRSFLHLHSETALILNIDRDHTDCYHSDEELFAAYAQFASQGKQVVVNADDRAAALPHTLSFGLYAGDYRAEKLVPDGERYSFLVTERGNPLVRISLNAIGRVHVQNALAAFACARLAGFSANEIKDGLESFRGVRRRFEDVGTLGGVRVICDYAHHPRELAAVMDSAQRLCKGTLRLVFQPHTYTRTKDLMEEFVRVLREAESPIVYKTYAARESFEGAGSAYTLVSRLPEALYVQTPQQLKSRLLEKADADDLILVLGAGDIYSIANSILDDKKPSG